MIIELGIYNSAEELLIETRTTGSQGHVCYLNGDQRISVTGWLSTWRRRGQDANRVPGHIQSVSESGMRTGMHRNTVEQSKKY